MKINLGCGEDIREGYINADIREIPGTIKMDACQPLPYEDNSVDVILAQKLLSYIPRAKLLPLLKEFYRTLKQGGTLEIRVTDLSLLTKALYLNNISKELGLHHEMVVALIFGKQSHQYDIKYNGFTSELIQGLLAGVGFKVHNVVNEEYDVILSCTKE